MVGLSALAVQASSVEVHGLVLPSRKSSSDSHLSAVRVLHDDSVGRGEWLPGGWSLGHNVNSLLSLVVQVLAHSLGLVSEQHVRNVLEVSLGMVDKSKDVVTGVEIHEHRAVQ